MGKNKALAKNYASVKGETKSDPVADQTYEIATAPLGDRYDASKQNTAKNLTRQQARWLRWIANIKKTAGKHSLRKVAHEYSHFVGFEELYTDVTKGVGSDPVAIHNRACLITTQAVMIGKFDVTWEDALEYAQYGILPMEHPLDPEKLIAWHDLVRLMMENMNENDQRLNQKMHTFLRAPRPTKRSHAHSIDAHRLREEALRALHAADMPFTMLEREAQQSFNPRIGSGYEGNVEKLKEYYAKRSSFTGDMGLLLACRDFVVEQILKAKEEVTNEPGAFTPMSIEAALGWLYVKTSGSTQVGGRFHAAQRKLGLEGYTQVVHDASRLTSLTTRLPAELGNRYVPGKNKYASTKGATPDDSIDSMINKWKIVDCEAKDRVTWAIYKGKQGADLAYMYPLQAVMSQMDWFSALSGHDATFNVNEPDNIFARKAFDFLRRKNVWGASWDFSRHDTVQQIALRLFYGQGEFSGHGVIGELFPSYDDSYWKWCYEASTQGGAYVEGGILYPAYGCERGLGSGEGITNGMESLIGIIVTFYSIARVLKERNAGLDEEIFNSYVCELIYESSLMGTMGDDTFGFINQDDFVEKAVSLFGEGFDCSPASPEEVAVGYGHMGWIASTDKRKISFFGVDDRERLWDFTAHQTYIRFDEEWNVEEHLHGHYCATRALAAYVWNERPSPEEALVDAAKIRRDGKIMHLPVEEMFNPEACAFFVTLQYSVCSSMVLNAQRFIDAVMDVLVWHAPQGFMIHSGARNEKLVLGYLKAMRVRESLHGMTPEKSPVFGSMINAYDKWLKAGGVIQDVITDWLALDNDTVPLDSYVAEQMGWPHAKWGWDEIFGATAIDDPSKNARMKEAKDSAVDFVNEVYEEFGDTRMADDVLRKSAKFNVAVFSQGKKGGSK